MPPRPDRHGVHAGNLVRLASSVLLAAMGLARTVLAAPFTLPEQFSVPAPVRPVVVRAADIFNSNSPIGISTSDGMQIWRRLNGTWAEQGGSGIGSNVKAFVRPFGSVGGFDLVYAWQDFGSPGTNGSLGYVEDNGVSYGPDVQHATNGVGQVNQIFGPVSLTTTQGSGLKLMLASDVRNVPGHTSDGGIFYVKLPLAVSNPPLFEATPYIPTGITSADLDGDGLPDQVLTSYEILNGGSQYVWHVATRLRHSNNTWGAWDDHVTGFTFGENVFAVDLNGDGKPDLAYSSDNDFVVALNNGAGGFPTRVTIPGPSGAGTDRMLLADLNGDGRPDLVFTGYHPGNNGYSYDSYGFWVRLNNGSGGFLPATYYGLAGPYNIVNTWDVEPAVSDFDGDGKVDLAITDADQGVVLVFYGDGSGAFRAPPVPIALSNDPARAIALGDLNGDGLNDLAIGLSSGTASVRTLLSQGGGAFQSSAGFDGGPLVTHVAVADADGDGRADVVLGRNADPPAFMPGGFNGYLNPPVTLDALGDGSGSGVIAGLVAVDLNGDGAADIVCVVNDGAAPHLEVRPSDGSGGFLPHQDYSLGGVGQGLALNDANLDHGVDAITSTEGSLIGTAGGIDVLPGLPNQAGFGDLIESGLDALPITGSPHPFALTRLTSVAGTRDLVLLTQDPAMSLFHDDGSGNFGLTESYALSDVPAAIAVGDLDGDGIPDAAIAMPSANLVAIFTGPLAGGTALETDYVVNSPVDVQIGDVTGDGKNDLVVLSSTAGPRPFLAPRARASRRLATPASAPRRLGVLRALSTASALTAFPGAGRPSLLSVPGPAAAHLRLSLASSPNPAHASALLRFTLPSAGPTRLELYDITGRRVARLVDGALQAGMHEARWSGRFEDGARAPAGIYLARLQRGGGSAVSRVVWMP